MNWFTQMILALKHVHDRRILHRDLKCGNIFLTKSGMIKIGDFGIARVLDKTQDMAATVVGTPYYLSPEIIQSNLYDYKTDVWSLGIILYEMCALQPPFNGTNLHHLAMQIVGGIYQPVPKQGRFSEEIQRLIKICLIVDPKQRPSINEILKVPIVARQVKLMMVDSNFFNEFTNSMQIHRQMIIKS